MVDINTLSTKAWELILGYAPKVILAIIVLVAGFWIIGGIRRMMRKVMEKRNVDPTLRPFLVKLVSVLLKVMLLISVAGMVGVQVTSFIAVLGAVGLAVGLALQGSLANFAGGVLILLLKPYKLGDYIEAQGEAGTVHAISIFHTVLKTPDNKTVTIPNGPMANGNITNYSTEDKRRMDMVFGIGYGDDIDKARKALQGLVKKEKRLLKTPEPVIVVSELADSSVNLILRFWVKKENYWDVKFALTEAVKKEFDKKKISIPFPQRDVHLYKSK